MAYRIDYSEGIAKKTDLEQGIRTRNIMTVTAIILLVICCVTVYSLGREGLYEIPIPGDSEATAAAAIKFVNEVQQGTSIVDAFEVFCREIIHCATY